MLSVLRLLCKLPGWSFFYFDAFGLQRPNSTTTTTTTTTASTTTTTTTTTTASTTTTTSSSSSSTTTTTTTRLEVTSSFDPSCLFKPRTESPQLSTRALQRASQS